MGIATLVMILSGLLGACSNLCMRKSLENEGSLAFFFVLQLFLTFLVVSYLHPVMTESYSVNGYTVIMASLAGLFLGVLKLFLRHALAAGPSSLTFASLNSASVAPSLILALIVGNQLVVSYTMYHAVGSLLVIIGLFWAIWSELAELKNWLGFAIVIFLLQTLFLLVTQSHTLILEHPDCISNLSLFDTSNLQSEWFVPIIFLQATLVQFFFFLYQTKVSPKKRELLWGILGGVLNGACAYFFMQGQLTATCDERAFLFPFFSIALIMTCNLWAKLLYKERVHWRAMTVCSLGLSIASI